MTALLAEDSPLPDGLPDKVARATNFDVADKLRTMILSQEDGAFLGSEDSLTQRLAASAPTMRQAARLLEREGLLRVKRGMGGGYFGVRPTYGSVETRVSEHLNTLHVPLQEVATVASVLWVEAVTQAARVRNDISIGIADRFRRKIDALTPTCVFHDVSEVELATRSVIFGLIEKPYFELIFRINSAFRTGASPLPATLNGSEEHALFVERWKAAKNLELHAIAVGNPEVAGSAARHQREIWDRRLLAAARSGR